MCGIFRGGRMPPRKIPPAPRTRCNAPGAKAGCAFFAPGFFAQAKKGGSCRHGAKAFEVRGESSSLRSPSHPPSGHLLPQAREGLGWTAATTPAKRLEPAFLEIDERLHQL